MMRRRTAWSAPVGRRQFLVDCASLAAEVCAAIAIGLMIVGLVLTLSP